jgi:hypothetical protein
LLNHFSTFILIIFPLMSLLTTNKVGVHARTLTVESLWNLCDTYYSTYLHTFVLLLYCTNNWVTKVTQIPEIAKSLYVDPFLLLKQFFRDDSACCTVPGPRYLVPVTRYLPVTVENRPKSTFIFVSQNKQRTILCP